MRTHTTIARLAVVGLTTFAAGACSDATSPIAPVVPPAPSLAKGGPNTLPVNGRIYFSSEFTGNMEVYSMKSDGSDRRRLTYTSDYESSLAVSRDGKKLAIGSSPFGAFGAQLHTMNTDGTNKRLVTSASMGMFDEPAWSPDGRTIAYAASPAIDNTKFGIWTVAASGGKETRLTPETLNATHPLWSPDGARIAYLASPVGLAAGDLYIMNADGSAPQLLFDCEGICTDPTWSPDGTRLVYLSQSVAGIQVQYCLMAQAQPWCGLTLAEEIIGTQLVFSPDGSQLAFVMFTLNGQMVATANSNGSAQTGVTGNLEYISDLAWGR